MKKVMMLVVAAISVVANANTRIFNLRDELKAKGYTVSSLVSGPGYSTTIAAKNAFDGIKGGSNGNDRWIATIPSAYVAIKIPDEIATKSRIVGYRIWRLTCGGNEINRSPKTCELRGVTKDADGNVKTNVLSTVTQNMSWSGAFDNEQFNEVYDLDLCGETYYTEYIWTPTSTGAGGNNNFGLMELEFLMSDDISDTTQYMNFNAKRFGNEVVPVTVEPKSTYDSIYKVGANVTLTVPATDEGRNFSRWYGTGFDETENENTSIEFTIGANNKAAPFYDGMWMLAWDEETRISGSQTGTARLQNNL